MQQAKASMPDDGVPTSSRQNVRFAAEVLTAAILARGRWLSAAVDALASSSFVDGAWLVGSLGSGTEDPYSDIDLIVAVDPSAPPAVFAEPVAGLRLPGPVLYTRAKPCNAPAGGAYRMICVELVELPVLVDLYLWPTVTAAVPQGARLLWSRTEPTRSPEAFMSLLDKHRTTDTTGSDPTDPTTTLMLIQLAAKYLARADRHRHAAIVSRLGVPAGSGTAVLRDLLDNRMAPAGRPDLHAAVAAAHRLLHLVDADRADDCGP